MADNLTILDLAKRTDPDGGVATVAEVLNATNEILLDMVWKEGNLKTGHRTSTRTGLPTPTWRKIGGGVQPTKSQTAQATFSTGMLEAYSETDKALADLGGNTNEVRMSEATAHIEGMSQEMADSMFYSNEESEPEAITGIAPYYNDLSANNADNIIDAGGTGSDNASIWLIVWDEEKIFGIVPQGSNAGIQVNDLGEQTAENFDGSQGRAQIYRTHFRWDAGLCVKDWRYGVRICNIDKSLLTRVYTAGVFSTGADLTDLMFQAMRLVPSLSGGRAAFYMSRDMATWVSRQTNAKGQNGLITVDPSSSRNSVSGSIELTERFHGIPMRRVDALAADEARVT